MKSAPLPLTTSTKLPSLDCFTRSVPKVRFSYSNTPPNNSAILLTLPNFKPCFETSVCCIYLTFLIALFTQEHPRVTLTGNLKFNKTSLANALSKTRESPPSLSIVHISTACTYRNERSHSPSIRRASNGGRLCVRSDCYQ